jgi:hypoxanthine phosphoribosyltransferase
MTLPKPAVLFSEAQIRGRIQELGAQVVEAFAGKEISVVGLMKSSLVFMADMIRAVPMDTTCHLLRASSRDQGTGSMRTDIVYATDIPFEGRHILLLDDIIDTGITLNYLLVYIRDHNPASLKVCALIDKPGERKIDVHPEWAAFTLKEPVEGFLVGYGLDYNELPRPVTSGPSGPGVRKCRRGFRTRANEGRDSWPEA